MGYLVEPDSNSVHPEHIEHRILANFDKYLFEFAEFIDSLGVHPHFSWYLIEVPTESLVPSVEGEIDILAGNIDPSDNHLFNKRIEEIHAANKSTHPTRIVARAMNELAWNHLIKWPPSLTHLAGIEVKSSYLPLTATKIDQQSIRSKKESPQALRKIHKSLDRLLKIGLNRIGLFEFIANPPCDGVGSAPWSEATLLAGKTLEEMESVHLNRLSEESPIGHAVSSVSGILGRDERDAGGMAHEIYQVAKENPKLVDDEQVKTKRGLLDQNLGSILSKLPFPYTLPAVYIFNKREKTFRWSNEGQISG